MIDYELFRLTREILGAVVRKWDENVGIIDKIIPQNWKNEPAGRILELCILHLAMAEIKTIGTRHQIVINEVSNLVSTLFLTQWTARLELWTPRPLRAVIFVLE